MRTYDEIYDDSTDEAPFSNGFEGESWMDRWCWTPCKKDRNEDCPLIMLAYMGRTPKEWTETNPGGLADRYTCSEFEPEDEGGPDGDPSPPIPVAEMDGQIDIFAVFTDAIVDEASRELVTS